MYIVHVYVYIHVYVVHVYVYIHVTMASFCLNALSRLMKSMLKNLMVRENWAMLGIIYM